MKKITGVLKAKGFDIHPYLSLDRTVSLVNWYKQTGLHEWQRAEHIVTRWKEVT